MRSQNKGFRVSCLGDRGSGFRVVSLNFFKRGYLGDYIDSYCRAY